MISALKFYCYLHDCNYLEAWPGIYICPHCHYDWYLENTTEHKVQRTAKERKRSSFDRSWDDEAQREPSGRVNLAFLIMKYKIVTHDDKVIFANTVEEVNRITTDLGDSFKELKGWTTHTRQPKTVQTVIRFTVKDREKYKAKAKELNFSSLQEYIKVLLMMDNEFKTILKWEPSLDHD